nr:hypothetical protein [Pseudopedobacter sp.]
MDIQTRKIEFVQELLKLENEELLTRLENLLHSDHSTKDKEFKPMSVTELNERIDKSMDDSKNNRLTNLTDLIAEIDKWD